MTKLVVFGPFRGFFLISLDFHAANGGMAQYQCPRLWAGLNTCARGDGWSLVSTPEAMGGA